VRSDDIAELMQCSHSTSKQVIKRLLSEGKAERFRGAAVTESGLVRSRVWYRLK
jgi:Mn-dependent DtxR family transcriptional regulator